MISVYVASPYTKPEGKKEENAIRSFIVCSELIKMGFAPYAPLWMHYMKEGQPDYEKCMYLDLFWLSKCDCLLRLSGESGGADREVEYAKELGIPIYFGMEEFIETMKVLGDIECK